MICRSFTLNSIKVLMILLHKKRNNVEYHIDKSEDTYMILLDDMMPYELETLILEATRMLHDKAHSTSTHHETIKRQRTIICPHCGGQHYVRNGHRNGVQRYLCRCCNKTFGDTANSIFFSTKLDYQTWLSFIQCEIQHLSLQETAASIQVSKTTCFSMRHKLYQAVKELKKTKH